MSAAAARPQPADPPKLADDFPTKVTVRYFDKGRKKDVEVKGVAARYEKGKNENWALRSNTLMAAKPDVGGTIEVEDGDGKGSVFEITKVTELSLGYTLCRVVPKAAKP